MALMVLSFRDYPLADGYINGFGAASRGGRWRRKEVEAAAASSTAEPCMARPWCSATGGKQPQQQLRLGSSGSGKWHRRLGSGQAVRAGGAAVAGWLAAAAGVHAERGREEQKQPRASRAATGSGARRAANGRRRTACQARSAASSGGRGCVAVPVCVAAHVNEEEEDGGKVSLGGILPQIEKK